ncbi:unnamed protein product [Cuscuta europaea]|uniref:Uncharacterized protein n=1 Tax=Cuscuta europaea TaxID=41803 RepID=A0A9P0ZW56_CUSEU|nr:unnamed protein product [Cuscuta europaea]
MEKAETNNVNNNGEEVAESTTAADHSERPNNMTCNNNSVIPAPVLDESRRGEFGTDVNQGDQGAPQPSWRTPFTDLSQIDADLALARTLQEQERAYMMLTMHGNGSDYVSEEEYVHDYRHDSSGDPSEVDDSHVDLDDEDAFDFHSRDEASDDENQGIQLDPAAFPSDEAYARALQEVEEREMTARLLALAGLNEGIALSEEDHGQNSQVRRLTMFLLIPGSPRNSTRLPPTSKFMVNFFQSVRNSPNVANQSTPRMISTPTKAKT